MPQAIHLYRPHRTSPEALEAVFVGREALLEEILRHLEGWKPKASRQHYLLIGPRGIGKTSLLRVIEHRIRSNPALSRKWVPAALAEDSYRISKVSDILIEALRVLSEADGLSQLADIYDKVRHDDDDDRIIDFCLDALRSVHGRDGSAILLMIENLNRFLGYPSSRNQARLLRKILIEEDWLLAILTSPTHLNAVTEPEEPLFEFFQVRHLPEFSPDEQQQMLRKMAVLEGNSAFEDYLAEFQSRLRALYHFTGGNPRLGVMLYDLVANHNIRQVRDELDLLLDQLTPFYQGRMKDLGHQNARLLEAMALLPEGCTPTELAKEARLPAKSVRSLMIRLEDGGYLRREQRRHKKTVYIIPERFFRIWHQMNHSRAARGRIQYLLEFFSSWYATRQERDRVWNEITSEFEHGLEERDEGRIEELGEYMSYVAEVSEDEERFERLFDHLVNSTDSLDTAYLHKELERLDRDYALDSLYFIYRGKFSSQHLQNYHDALKAFQKAYQLDQECALPLLREILWIEKRLDGQSRKEFQEFAIELTTDLDSDFEGARSENLRDLIENAKRPTWAIVVAAFKERPRVEQVLTALLSSESSWKRGWSATMLGRLGCRKAVQALILALGDEASYARGSAATALGRIGARQSIEALIQAVQDDDNIVRGSAVTALGRIGSSQAVKPLIQALKDEASNVRGSAATALGSIGSRQAVEPLIQTLQDSDSINRGSAATALGRIGSNQAVEPLILALKDEASSVRGSAATALGRIGSNQAVEPLILALKDEASEVRGSAATALGRIGSSNAVAPLIQTLQDNSYVRISVASALGRIGDEQATDQLIERLRDKSMGVRQSCAVALARLAEGRPFDCSSRILLALAPSGLHKWPRIEFVVDRMLESAFRTGELEVVQSSVDTCLRHFAEESAWLPYTVAMKFLSSGRDPAIMERQHPEMREAAQLLIGLFDSASNGDAREDAQTLAEVL